MQNDGPKKIFSKPLSDEYLKQLIDKEHLLSKMSVNPFHNELSSIEINASLKPDSLLVRYISALQRPQIDVLDGYAKELEEMRAAGKSIELSNQDIKRNALIGIQGCVLIGKFREAAYLKEHAKLSGEEVEQAILNGRPIHIIPREHLIEMQRQLGLPKEFNRSVVEHLIIRGDIGSAIDLLQDPALKSQGLKLEEFKGMMATRVKDYLDGGHFRGAKELITTFKLSSQDIEGVMVDYVWEQMLKDGLGINVPGFLKDFSVNADRAREKLLKRIESKSKEVPPNLSTLYKLVNRYVNELSGRPADIQPIVDIIFEKAFDGGAKTIVWARRITEKELPVSPSVRQSLKIREKALEVLPYAYAEGSNDRSFLASFKFSGSEVQGSFKKAIEETIRNRNLNLLGGLLESDDCPGKVGTYSGEIKEQALRLFLLSIDSENYRTASRIVSEIGITRDTLVTNDRVEEATERIILLVTKDQVQTALQLANTLQIRPECDQAFLEKGSYYLQDESYASAKNILQHVSSANLSQAQDVAFEGVMAQITDPESTCSTLDVRDFLRSMNVPFSRFQTPENQERLTKSIENAVVGGHKYWLNAQREIIGFRVTIDGQRAENIINSCLEDGDFETLLEVLEETNFSTSLKEPQLAELICESLDQNGWSSEVPKVIVKLGIGHAHFQQEPIRSEILEVVLDRFATGEIEEAEEAIQLAGIKPEEVKELVPQAVAACMKRGEYSRVEVLIEKYKLDQTALTNNPDVRQAALECFATNIRRGVYNDAEALCRTYRFTQAELDQHIAPAIVAMVSYRIAEIKNAQELLGAIKYTPQAPMAEIPVSGSFHARYIQHYDLKTAGEYLQFSAQHIDYLTWLMNHDKNILLTRQELESLKRKGADHSDKLPLSETDAHNLKAHRVDLEKIYKDKDYDLLLREMANISDIYSIIVGSGDCRGVIRVLGAEKVCRLVFEGGFTSQPELFFTAVGRLLSRTSIEPDKIYHTLLLPLAFDKSEYGVHENPSKAPDEFVRIVSQHDLNTDSLRKSIARYPDLVELRQADKEFEDKEAPFRSWNALKRYAKVSDLVCDAVVMQHLVELQRADPQYYSFLMAFYLNPDSRISGATIRQFWLDPGNFLSRFPHGEVMNPNLKPLLTQIRPSALTSILPTLGLEAQEITRALVDGTLDNLQKFTPLSLEFEIPVSGIWYSSVREALSGALGKRSQGISGRAVNTNKLFKVVKDELAKHKVNLMDYLNGNATVSPEVEAWIYNKAYDKEIGIQENWTYVLATLHSKRDPIGLSAADDTASCMPFGSVKANIYLFDPNISYFTLRVRRDDGGYRTIAQSVITKDMDIDQDYSAIYQKMKGGRTDIFQLLRNAPNFGSKWIIGCDNVQMAPNYADSSYSPIVQAAYACFFAEYVSRFGEAEMLDEEWVAIGHGSSKCVDGLKLVASTYIPSCPPIGYSDRHEGQVYELPINGAPYFRMTVKGEDTQQSKCPNTYVSGVSPLHSDDLLGMSYLHGASLQEMGMSAQCKGIQNMRLAMLAVEMKNAASAKPEFNFKFLDDRKTLRGYIFAYEGRDKAGDTIVVVDDFCADNGSQKIGYRLLRKFMDRYTETYASKGVFPRIKVEMPFLINGGSEMQEAVRKLMFLARKFGYVAEVGFEPPIRAPAEFRSITIDLRPRGSNQEEQMLDVIKELQFGEDLREPRRADGNFIHKVMGFLK